MKTLVLGLGNTILCDDGVGIYVARAIKKKCNNIDVVEASAAGFRIVDEIIGYNKLILIDSIKTQDKDPGTLYTYDFNDLNKTSHNTSPHDISLFEAFQIVKQQNYEVPDDIIIYAIEVEDTETLAEHCTPKVENAIPEITVQIIKENRLC